MRTPKLTWAEFKDANGNWLPTLTPPEIISLLEVRLSNCHAERQRQAARIASLTEALDASMGWAGRVKAELNERLDEGAAQAERIAALEADRDAWRPIVEAVRLFAGGWEHAYDCPIALNVQHPCDCGREQVLVALERLATEGDA